MKNIRTGILLVAGVFLFASCATMFTKGGTDYRQADRELNSGNYVSAISSVLAALEKNPEFPEALELFPRAFNTGTEALLDITKDKSAANADTAWKAWQDLVAMNKLVAASGRREVKTADYTAEEAAAKQYVLEVHYDYAEELLAMGDRDKAIEAVGHFKHVYDIDNSFRDVDARFSAAVEAATLDIAVDTGLPGREIPELYHRIISRELEDKAYVRIVPIEKYDTSAGGMVMPIDAMVGGLRRGDIDYAISMYSSGVDIDFPTYSNDCEIIPGTAISYDGRKWSRGYSVSTNLEYRVLGENGQQIDAGELTHTENDGITGYYVIGRLYEDLDFGDGSGKNNTIVAEMINSDFPEEAIYNVLNEVRRKTLNYGIPVELEIDPYDRMLWKDYFLANYNFESLKDEFNEAWFCDAKALFMANQKTYWRIFSSDPAENDHWVKISFAMHQALAGAASELAKEAVEDETYYHTLMAGKLADYIKETF